MVHHDDPVGLFYRGQAVRDDNRCAGLRHFIHGLLNRAFAFGIQRRGGLVQKQNWRVAQDRPGDGDALFLSARKHHAAFADISVIAFGQGRNEVMRRRSARCGLDLGIGGLGAAKANVVACRGGEDHRVLRHQGQRLAEGAAGHGVERHAIKADLPRLWVIEALNQLDHACFAGPRWADKRHGFARRHGERDIVKGRRIRPRGIGEAHVIKGNLAPDRVGKWGGVGGVLYPVGGAQKFLQAFGGPCGALQLAPDFRQGRHGPRHHDRIDHELHQCPGAHFICPHIARAHPQHAHHAGKDQKDHDHGHRRPGGDPAFGRIKAFFRHITEPLAALIFVGESLHRLHAQQRLGGIARRIGDPVLIFAAKFAQAAAEREDRHDNQRHDQQDHSRQLGRGDQHEHQATKEDQKVAQRDRHRGANHRQDQRGIGSDPAKHLAGHYFFVKRRAHADNAVENRLANIGHNPLTQPRDQCVA